MALMISDQQIYRSIPHQETSLICQPFNWNEWNSILDGKQQWNAIIGQGCCRSVRVQFYDVLSVFSPLSFLRYLCSMLLQYNLLSFNTWTSVTYCNCTFRVYSMAELVDVFEVGLAGIIPFVAVLQQQRLSHSQLWTSETWLTWQQVMLRDTVLITGCILLLQSHQKNTGYGLRRLTPKLCTFMWRS